MKVEPRVVWQDENMLVLLKPAGWLCAVDDSPERNWHLRLPREASAEALVRTRAREHIAHFLMLKFGSSQDFPLADGHVGFAFRWGLAHRLDVDTSGLLLVGKTRLGFRHLREAFRAGAVYKEYVCLVHGRVGEAKGVIDAPIAKVQDRHFAYISRKRGSWAHTAYYVLDRHARGDQLLTLCRVVIASGRTHQIRVHMASLGHPLVGDVKYGAPRSDLAWCPRIFLHARCVQFTDLRGERMKVEAPLTRDLASTMGSAWLHRRPD